MSAEPSDQMLAIEMLAIVEKIKPILAGQLPNIQGAVLADLTAIWLAGHPPDVRNEMLDFQIKMIRRLTTVNDEIFYGEVGHPGGRYGN